MNLDSALVDEIVRRVMEQLPDANESPRAEMEVAAGTSPGEPVTGSGRYLAPAPSFADAAVVVEAPPPSAATRAPAIIPTASTAGQVSHVEVAIAERVITAELLESRLGGASRLRVSAKALLTPSARDVVRSRRLEVIRDSGDARTSTAPRGRWLVLTAQPVTGLDGALSNWRGTGARVESRLTGDVADAAAQATSAICRGEAEAVLVLTTAPEWAACLANRNDRIRAAAISDASAIERLRDTLKPNVLALDASRRGAFELAGLLKVIDR